MIVVSFTGYVLLLVCREIDNVDEKFAMGGCILPFPDLQGGKTVFQDYLNIQVGPELRAMFRRKVFSVLNTNSLQFLSILGMAFEFAMTVGLPFVAIRKIVKWFYPHDNQNLDIEIAMRNIERQQTSIDRQRRHIEISREMLLRKEEKTNRQKESITRREVEIKLKKQKVAYMRF